MLRTPLPLPVDHHPLQHSKEAQHRSWPPKHSKEARGLERWDGRAPRFVLAYLNRRSTHSRPADPRHPRNHQNQTRHRLRQKKSRGSKH